MACQSKELESGKEKRVQPGGWLPPADVLIACVLGCLLPAIAYAQAMAAFFRFSGIQKRWAVLLIVVPTLVWTVPLWVASSQWDASAFERSTTIGFVVGGSYLSRLWSRP